MYTQRQQDIFVESYTTQLFESNDPHGEPWAENFGFEDLSPDAAHIIETECKDFMRAMEHQLGTERQDLFDGAWRFCDERNGEERPDVDEEFRAKALSMQPSSLYFNEEDELLGVHNNV